ncbi:MAG TPA: hypothetical protein V6C81_13640 [Planktothrix sp.]|jgi:hypothetical protein
MIREILINRKALLAIAFTSSVLNSPLPAFPRHESKTDNSAIETIANNSRETAEVRAYTLLKLAQEYIDFLDRDAADARYKSASERIESFNRADFERLLMPWAKDLASEQRNASNVGYLVTNFHTELGKEKNSQLAKEAINLSLAQLQDSRNDFAKWNLYFIAFCLFQQINDLDGANKCNDAIDVMLKSCESKSSIDEDSARAASSVLDAMAYGWLPIENFAFGKRGYTEEKFKESEKLRLQAVAILDQLGKSNHYRIEAHKDIVLWYVTLGKTEAAETQKQIFFELVGRKDDNLLYPMIQACGHLQYRWHPGGPIAIGCGMG